MSGNGDPEILQGSKNTLNEALFNAGDIQISYDSTSFLNTIAFDEYEEVDRDSSEKLKCFTFELSIEEDTSAKVILMVKRKDHSSRIQDIHIDIKINKDLLKRSAQLVAVVNDDAGKCFIDKDKIEAAEGLLNLSRLEETLPKPIPKQVETCKNCQMPLNGSNILLMPIVPTYLNSFSQIYSLKPDSKTETSSLLKGKIKTFDNLPPHPDEIQVLIDKRSPVRDEKGLLEEYRNTEWRSGEWAGGKLCGFHLHPPPPPALLYQRKSCGANRKEQNELNPYELTDEDFSQITNGTLATSIREALNKYSKTKSADHNVLVWKSIMDRVVNLRQSNKHKREKLQKEKWFTATVAVLGSHFLSVREAYREVLAGLKQPIEIVHVLNEIDTICEETPEKYDDRIKRIVEYAREEADRKPKKRAFHVKGESPFPDEPKNGMEIEEGHGESGNEMRGEQPSKRSRVEKSTDDSKEKIVEILRSAGKSGN